MQRKKTIENLGDKKIRAYCGTSYKENIAADELVKEGFNAGTLDGSYPSWNQS